MTMDLPLPHTMLFGADYNPDQWDRSVWDEDLRLMKELGVNVVSIPILSWAQIEVNEGVFEFGWLDEAMNRLEAAGICVVMATPSFAQPAWMSEKYPAVLPVTVTGMRRKHGARGNFCPNNPDFLRLARRMAQTLAGRYGTRPNLILWHVNNEYGPACWCETCRRAFHRWLEAKYGTIEELNRRWNTAFWSHRYNRFDQIETPSHLNEVIPGGLVDRDASFHQPISLDYQEFQSDSIRACYLNEAEVLRKTTPSIPVTTNIPCGFKQIDWYAWDHDIDVAAWDNYPSNSEMSHPYALAIMAMKHDWIRGLRRGQPFYLMEQTPSQQNWLPYNVQKRPGEMSRWSWQAVAHGADAVMFFQFRQSRSGFEKFHAAFVPHSGGIDNRVSREVQQLGRDLARLPPGLIGARVPSRVAFLVDWRNWWAAELSSGPTVALKYQDQLLLWYQWFWHRNLPVDFVRPTDDLSGYSVVLAPMLYMASEAVTLNVESFVAQGGRFLTTYFSGIVDRDDSVYLGGTPGAFRRLLGLVVEETDALAPPMFNRMVPVADLEADPLDCHTVYDVVRLEGAQVLATYQSEYYAGQAAWTVHSWGKGHAHYVGSVPSEPLVERILSHLTRDLGLRPAFPASGAIELSLRQSANGSFVFGMNHGATAGYIDLGGTRGWDVIRDHSVSGRVEIPAGGTRVLWVVSTVE